MADEPIIVVAHAQELLHMFVICQCRPVNDGLHLACIHVHLPVSHDVVTACMAFGVLLAPTVLDFMTSTLSLWSRGLGPDMSVPNLKIGHCMSVLSIGLLTLLTEQAQ